MKKVSFDLAVRFARRIPDPVFEGAERHVLICPVESIPRGLPKDPNPREQNIDRGVWKEIRKHLFNRQGEPNTFHLKNKGITIVASGCTKVTDTNYRLDFVEGDGILDGGHTYELLVEAAEAIKAWNEAEDPDDQIQQYVKIEVLTGVDGAILTEIAGGLNTAIQVQKMSLENLKGTFEWVKDELALEPYMSNIAFKENEPDRLLDIRDIVVMLDLFNVGDFPNDSSEHPVRAYMSKSSVLDRFVEDRAKYEMLRPLLKDILTLHDTIASEARVHHNEAGGKAGKLSFIEKRERGSYKFPFLRKKGKPVEEQYRLASAAAYPMLAAFRWCVEINPKTKKAHWTMPFSKVLDLWESAAPELMKATKAANDANGRKANAIGRSAMHWANLHNIVAKRSLMMKAAS